jgi:5-formyltetrahydrofolate cyclo-ligase
MDQDMEFLSVNSMMDLSPDFMGIREPAFLFDNLFQLHTSQVEQVFMVMPALAFDTNGNRIGFGKGYYDRYLKRIHINKRIGICYDFQIMNEIPCTTQDISATMVISDKRIIRCH